MRKLPKREAREALLQWRRCTALTIEPSRIYRILLQTRQASAHTPPINFALHGVPPSPIQLQGSPPPWIILNVTTYASHRPTRNLSLRRYRIAHYSHFCLITSGSRGRFVERTAFFALFVFSSKRCLTYIVNQIPPWLPMLSKNLLV